MVLGCFRRGLRQQRHGQSAEALRSFRLAVKDASPMVATAAHNVRAAQFFLRKPPVVHVFCFGGEGGGSVRDTTTPHWKLFGCVISLVWHVWERALYKNYFCFFFAWNCTQTVPNHEVMLCICKGRVTGCNTRQQCGKHSNPAILPMDLCSSLYSAYEWYWTRGRWRWKTSIPTSRFRRKKSTQIDVLGTLA